MCVARGDEASGSRLRAADTPPDRSEGGPSTGSSDCASVDWRSPWDGLGPSAAGKPERTRARSPRSSVRSSSSSLASAGSSRPRIRASGCGDGVGHGLDARAVEPDDRDLGHAELGRGLEARVADDDLAGPLCDDRRPPPEPAQRCCDRIDCSVVHARVGRLAEDPLDRDPLDDEAIAVRRSLGLAGLASVRALRGSRSRIVVVSSRVGGPRPVMRASRSTAPT